MGGRINVGSLKDVGKYELSIASGHGNRLALWIYTQSSDGKVGQKEVYSTGFKSPQIVINTYRRLSSVKAIEDYLKHRIPEDRIPKRTRRVKG